MRYVGFGALAIGYWANVVLLHFVLADQCLPVAVDPRPTDPTPARQILQPSRFNPKGIDDVDCAYPNDVQERAAPGAAAGPMTKSALVAGLNSVRPLVHACYQRFEVPGVAMVNVVIAKSGLVTKADVTGKFAGTPTGACVERAMKTASFPPSDGFSTPYPFQLK